MSDTMKAMQVVEHGLPLVLNRVVIPVPSRQQVRLRIDAVGINFADLLLVNGTYQEKPGLPFTPGMEVSGTIDALGEDVEGLRVGQRAAAYFGRGGLAEFGCFPAANCILVPDSMPPSDAASFLIVYGTSHVALSHRAKLRNGERLLVLGAAGGVGMTAIEIGRLLGAEVIAAARGSLKTEAAKSAGAHHVINTECEDVRTVVRSLGGADVVFDPVGGELFKTAMRSANPEARLIPVGFASGQVPQIPANILLVKNITVIGLYWGAYMNFAPHVLRDSAHELLDWYIQGKLHPKISHRFALEEANQALDTLRNRQAVGKVVVQNSQDL